MMSWTRPVAAKSAMMSFPNAPENVNVSAPEPPRNRALVAPRHIGRLGGDAVHAVGKPGGGNAPGAGGGGNSGANSGDAVEQRDRAARHGRTGEDRRRHLGDVICGRNTGVRGRG